MSSNSRKYKVLYVSYGFPPMAGSGIQRAVRFVQNLADSEWEPIVLTVTRWGNDLENPDWVKHIPPGVKVYRVFSLDPFRFLNLFRKNRPHEEDSGAIENGEGKYKLSLAYLLKNIYYRLSIPDKAVWWALPAVLYGLFIIVKHRPALIFSTSGPYGTSIAALILKKISGLKWIAEFRDPWAANTSRFDGNTRRKIETAMERSCLTNASGIIATTEATTDEFRQRTPPGGCGEFITITNGFKKSDFISFEPAAVGDVMQIVYTGMFYGERTPKYFFEGIRKACLVNADLADKIHFTIAGTMGKDHKKLVGDPPLDKMITILPYCSHDKVLELLKSSHVLFLMLSGGEKDIIAAKLFEYLAARRWVFATVPEGINADLIRKHETGFVIPPYDTDEISDKLIDTYSRFQYGKLHTSHSLEDISEYSWEKLSEKLKTFYSGVFPGV